MDAELAAYLCIAVMAVVTYFTRIGGVVAMKWVTVTPRIEAFLRGLASSVLVAIVVPAAAKGGPAAWLAVGVTLLIMITTRNTLAAMSGGIASAALLRLFV